MELAGRLADVRRDVRVLGLEIDPDRVAAAAASADPPRLEFGRGGFELAGRRAAVLVRALNVLRQYEEPAAAAAWAEMCGRLAPGGLLVEGTCDELGRRACWVALDAGGPLTITLAARVADLDRPSDLAERLPKALIHHNVPGEPVHELLRAFDRAWALGGDVCAVRAAAALGRRGRAAGGRRLAGGRRPVPLAAGRDHAAVVVGVRSVISTTRSGEECTVNVTGARCRWNDAVRGRRDAGGERDGGGLHR